MPSPWHDNALRGLKPGDVARMLADADAGDLNAQARLFADMLDRDAVIASTLEQRSMAVVGLPWSIDPPSNPTAQEQRASAFVADLLEGGIDALEDVLLALMDAVGFGYSAVEIAWKRERGLWLPDLHPRPHSWLAVSADGRALELATDGGSEPLRPLSWIVHQPKLPRAGYVSRGGAFRALAWPFVYKSYAVGDFAEFLETFGLPFVIGKYGRDASEDDKSRLLAAVASLSHNARAIMPLEMQMEIQRVSTSGTDSPHLAMVRWADDAITRAMLGQTLSSQAKSTGLGSGVADLQAEVRHDLRDADARQLAATISRDLLWPLAALNFGLSDPRRAPRLRFDTAQADDMSTYAQAIPALAASGVPIPVGWVRDKLGIPLAAEGEAVVGGFSVGAGLVPARDRAAGAKREGARPAPTEVHGCGCVACNTSSGDYHSAADDPTPVGVMSVQMHAAATPAWQQMMANIEQMVQNASSLDTLRDQLLAAYGDLDAGALSEVLALGMAAAHLAGRYEVERDGG